MARALTAWAARPPTTLRTAATLDAAIPMRFRNIGSAEAQATISGPPNAVVVERR